MIIKKKFLPAVLCITAVLMLTTACASTPSTIPADTTPEQLIQMAQQSYDNGNTSYAIYCYETMLDRYGDHNLEFYIIAQYEISHLLVHEGKADQAKPRLENLLSYYSNDEVARTLPPEYRKLAENELQRIAAKK